MGHLRVDKALGQRRITQHVVIVKAEVACVVAQRNGSDAPRTSSTSANHSCGSAVGRSATRRVSATRGAASFPTTRPTDAFIARPSNGLIVGCSTTSRGIASRVRACWYCGFLFVTRRIIGRQSSRGSVFHCHFEARAGAAKLDQWIGSFINREITLDFTVDGFAGPSRMGRGVIQPIHDTIPTDGRSSRGKVKSRCTQLPNRRQRVRLECMGANLRQQLAPTQQLDGVKGISGFALRSTPRVGLLLGGRYRIIGVLGAGSTAEVYLADDTATLEQVVIKWLTVRAARDPQLRERFLLGGRVAMAIEHPAIAKVHAVEELEGRPPYQVMEALAGESLAEYLEREGCMPEPLVLSLARDAAAGLLAAHHAGIIHRDVKPANIFLVGPKATPTGLKLIDFGLAKDVNRNLAGPTSTNIVMGTGQYMAPEQVLADPIDGRTDIYGLGVVLFRMLTGQLPFDLDIGIDLLSHQLFSPAPPPSWLVENIDPRVERIVLRCMRKHPENRYASMADLLRDLEAVLDTDHVRVISRPSSTPTMSARSRRRPSRATPTYTSHATPRAAALPNIWLSTLAPTRLPQLRSNCTGNTCRNRWIWRSRRTPWPLARWARGVSS